MPATVENVRARLAEARALLLSASPEESARSIPVFEQAVADMHAIEPTRDALPELRALQFEIGVIARLAARGAAYYRNWAVALAAAAGYSAASYTAAGDPTPLTATRSISLKG